MHRTGMASGQLPEFIRNDLWAYRFAWPMDCHVWGAMLQAYHKLHPKPKSTTELKEALQVIWDRLPQESINKAVKNFTLQLKRCAKSWSEHTKWLSDIRHNVHCVVSVTLFCCVSAQTFFSTRKLLSGHAKISNTMSYLKIIKCHLAVKCRQDSRISVQNFTPKFPAAAQKQ